MKIIKIFAAVLTMVSLLMSCVSNDNQQKQTPSEEGQNEILLTEQQMKAVDIELGQIEQKNLAKIIRASGNIEADPQSRADVTSLISGMIKKICVNEGDVVRQGQTVAWIENTEIIEMQRNYLTALRESQAAQQELKRQQNLSSQGAGVNKTLQQAQNALSIAQASVTGLACQLRQLSISPSNVANGNFSTRIPLKAPINGTVGKIPVSIGSYVDVSTVLMNIINDDRVHCDVMVYEKDIDCVKKGQEVDITLTNRPDVHISGRVEASNSSFVNDAKAIKVHVAIKPSAGAKLLPGASVNALINLNSQKVDALPDDAIVDVGGKKYIFVQSGIKADNKTHSFSQVEVGTGTSELGYTHIMPVSLIPKGAVVVKKNAFYIQSMIEGGEDED